MREPRYLTRLTHTMTLRGCCCVRSHFVASTRFTRTRAKIGMKCRQLPADHPDIQALRDELPGALVVHRIGLIIEKSPVPLTPQLRAEIEALLAERQVVAA